MSNLQDLLKARSAAVGSAKADGAIPGSKNADEVKKLSPEEIANLGTTGTTEVTPGVTGHEVKDAAELDEERAKAAIAVYQATGLKRYSNIKGVLTPAVKGYFYAEDDSDVVILEHFASVGKVEKVEKK